MDDLALPVAIALVVLVVLSLLIPRDLGGARGGIESYEESHAPDDPALQEFEANVERSRTIPPR
jgi:hypothetical protein